MPANPWAARAAMRLEIRDRRYIVAFLGGHGETVQDATQDVTMMRMQGEVDPVTMVKGLWSIKNTPGLSRSSREARAAWVDLLGVAK
jgi:hypothetical protein